ncbi:MAG TPA: hypothetical protein VFK05_28560, partial [Polyangiaceae bacterium]|nr:hypothetical protein [Polyangiaceae bacterium]
EIFALRDQVHVIVLYGVVYDAKPIPIAIPQPSEQRARYLLLSQKMQPCPQGDVHRVRFAVRGSRTMRSLP